MPAPTSIAARTPSSARSPALSPERNIWTRLTSASPNTKTAKSTTTVPMVIPGQTMKVVPRAAARVPRTAAWPRVSGELKDMWGSFGGELDRGETPRLGEDGADVGDRVRDAVFASQGFDGERECSRERFGREAVRADARVEAFDGSGPEGLVDGLGDDDGRLAGDQGGAGGAGAAVMDNGRGLREEPAVRDVFDGQHVGPAGGERVCEQAADVGGAECVGDVSGKVLDGHASEADVDGWRAVSQEAGELGGRGPAARGRELPVAG